MNINDCIECDWMSQDIDGVCFCSLYGDKSIEDVVFCDPNNLNYNEELLIIEEGGSK